MGEGAKENTRGRAVLDCKSSPGPTLLNENALHLDTKISMPVKTLFYVEGFASELPLKLKQKKLKIDLFILPGEEGHYFLLFLLLFRAKNH